MHLTVCLKSITIYKICSLFTYNNLSKYTFLNNFLIKVSNFPGLSRAMVAEFWTWAKMSTFFFENRNLFTESSWHHNSGQRRKMQVWLFDWKFLSKFLVINWFAKHLEKWISFCLILTKYLPDSTLFSCYYFNCLYSQTCVNNH